MFLNLTRTFFREQWWVYTFLDWRVGPSAAIWYISISLFIIICFFFQMLVHKFRDWVSKQMSIKRYGSNNNQGNTKTTVEKPNTINQNSNFEPLASTIGGSRITFGDSLPENQTNESSIYY